MKPRRLEMRGFTAFRDQAVLDFTDRQLFAITGPTGAGKSSILDAMTWALYGHVPRVGRSVRELVSHGEKSMAVHFEFEARGRCYRISRRAPGATATRLERATPDGEWQPLADRARDVTDQVERILGMDYATFTKTIILPQGAFDAFLRGDAKDRRAILTSLLGLAIYDDARGIAHQRSAAATQRAEAAAHHLALLQHASAEGVATLEAQRAELDQTLATLQERRTALQGLSELARARHEAQQAARQAVEQAAAVQRDVDAARRTLEEATERLAAAEGRIAAVERERAELAYDAEAHEALRLRVQLLRQREEAQGQVTAAQRDVEGAERALDAAHEAEQAARGALDAAASDMRQAHEQRDAARAALAAVVAAARASHAANTNEAAMAETEARAYEERAATSEERVREIETLARALAEARIGLDGAVDAHAAASAQAAEAESAAGAALVGRDAAEADVATCRAAFDEARAHDAAAALRAGLRPGDPCPVCGEPIAALPAAAPGDAAGIETSRAALEAAEGVLAQRRAEADRAAMELATARARAEQQAKAEQQARTRLEAAEQALAGAEVEGDASEAIARARAAVTEAREQATALLDRARERREAAQVLAVALARAPRDLPEADPSDDIPTADAVAAAVDAHVAAVDGAREAEEAQRRAESDAVSAAERVGTAEQQVGRERGRLEAAERRLAEFGETPEEDPEALRRSLTEAEERRRRDAELQGDAQRAAVDRAGAAEAKSNAEGQRGQLDQRLRDHEASARSAQATVDDATGAFAERWQEVIGEGEPDLRVLKQAMEQHDAEQGAASQRLGALDAQLEQARRDAETAARMTREIDEQRAVAALAGNLSQELQGNHFVAYVQSEAMRLLAADASERLAGLTSGRYTLGAEGDAFFVIDHQNGNEQRSVKTLSGGETFLASLALSLALSEHLPELAGTGGAMSLESLFLDEGFGALDVESLDLAVQGIEALALDRRMIGVISHVEELAERLPDLVRVEKTGETSVIRAE